jgi:hypothetical protein
MTQFLQFDLSFSPLQAGLRILPMAAVLVVCAVFSPVLARNIGTKLTVAGALAAVAGGLWQISAASTSTTSYGRVLPGLLLIGLGAGLLLPTATNSVVGSVPQGDSGIGSAINTMALQVGGAIGVAVIGSVLATRYQNHMSHVLVGRHLPTGVTHTILGSFGGALAVADGAGATRGALLARAAREAFMSGLAVSFLVAAVVALGGAVIVLVWLPSIALPGAPSERPDDERPLQGLGETSQQVWASQSGLSSTEASTASIPYVRVVKRPPGEFDQRSQRDEGSHEPCREAVSNECPEPQAPVRIRLARRPLE